MQCKRCKTFFKYDKYDGICPQCAYFNRPPGMEEVDLFEDDVGHHARGEERHGGEEAPDGVQAQSERGDAESQRRVQTHAHLAAADNEHVGRTILYGVHSPQLQDDEAEEHVARQDEDDIHLDDGGEIELREDER